MDDSIIICVICKSEKEEQELPCGHGFCQGCISRMEIEKDYTCPICRKPWREEQADRAAAAESAVMRENNSNRRCLICKSDKKEQELPCGHEFCQRCITRKEVLEDCKCPICKEPWGEEQAEGAAANEYALMRENDPDLLCPICKSDKKDLELRCGHEFCQICISRMEIQKSYKCPTCGELWREEQAEGALKIENDSKFDDEIKCPEHKKPISFWCEDCKQLTCSKCVSTTHHQHNFHPTEDVVHGMKGNIVNKRIAKQNEVDEQKKIIKNTNDKLKKLDEDLVEFQSAVKKDQENWKAANDVRDEYLERAQNIDYLLDKGDSSNIACVYSRCSDIISTCPKEEFPKVTSDDLISNLMHYGDMQKELESKVTAATERFQQREKDEKEKFQAEIRALKDEIKNLKKNEGHFTEESNNKFKAILGDKDGEIQQLKEDCGNLRHREAQFQEVIKNLMEVNKKKNQIESFDLTLKEENNYFPVKLGVKDGEIQQLKEDCGTLRHREAQFQAEIKTLQEKINNLKREEEEFAEESNIRFKVTLEDKDGEIQRLKEKCENLRHKEAQLQADLRASQKEIEGFKKEKIDFPEANQKNEQIESLQQIMKEERINYTATIGEKDREIRQLKDECGNLRHREAQLQDELRSSQEAIVNLMEEKDDLLAEANNRKKQKENSELTMMEEKNHYTVKLREKDGEIQQLKHECGTLRHREAQFQAEIRTLQEKINNLKREEEEFVEESNNKFKVTLEEMQQLEEECESLRQSVAQLNSRV